MRFMSVVAAALVATVVFSGVASAQMHPPVPSTKGTAAATSTPATGPAAGAAAATPAFDPMAATVQLPGPDGHWAGQIYKLVIGRTAGAPPRGYWYLLMYVRGAHDSHCTIKSTDRALIFSLRQQILDYLGRSMDVDCTEGTYSPTDGTTVDLDSQAFNTYTR